MSNRKRYLDAADVERLNLRRYLDTAFRQPAPDPALLPMTVLSDAEAERLERRNLWLEGHGG